jgi:hypothetical protein
MSKMLKLTIFSLLCWSAISYSSADSQEDDCGSVSFDMNNFHNVYIFNWLCKTEVSPEMNEWCAKPKPKPGKE